MCVSTLLYGVLRIGTRLGALLETKESSRDKDNLLVSQEKANCFLHIWVSHPWLKFTLCLFNLHAWLLDKQHCLFDICIMQCGWGIYRETHNFRKLQAFHIDFSFKILIGGDENRVTNYITTWLHSWHAKFTLINGNLFLAF